MPIWLDIATWVGPTGNTSGSIADHMYVVIHTADGSYDGTIAWQRNPQSQISSHFIVAKDGRIGQMLDTNAKGWTQIEGNPYSISIENEGNENTPLTAGQIEACAQILARAHAVHGVPLQLTGKVGVRGLGHHSMGAESGVNWGHSQCPGNIIKAQKPQILARAQQLAGAAIVLASTVTPATPTPPTEDPVFFLALAASGQYYLCDGMRSVPVTSAQIADLRTLRDEGLVAVGKNSKGQSTLEFPRTGWTPSFGKVDAAPAATVTLTPDQLAAITAAIVAHPDNPLGDADKPAIEQAVAAAFGKAFPSP